MELAVESKHNFRSLEDGYRRGWGLLHSDLGREVSEDRLFQEAQQAAGGLSLLSPERQKNFFLMIRDGLPKLASQNIVEFGSYKGGNALFMAAILRRVAPGAKVYALDTYAGMPETEAGFDMHGAGDFGDASVEALQQRAAALGLDNLIPVKGLFDQTFPTLSDTYGLAHIDCDIISAVRYSQMAVWPHMAPGGYVVFDDSNTPSCLGATQAVEEMIIERRIMSEQAWPHHVFRA